MNLNLNFSGQAEYNINDSLVAEMINLYGVEIKILLTEKINSDNNVFGDFSHFKTNNTDVFNLYAMPEQSEDFSTDGYSFSPFGMMGLDNVVLFVSRESLMKFDAFLLDGKVDFRKLQSQLIVFPNNKIMEISDADAVVQGVNNLFTYENAKSVYKLTCKPYAAKIVNEVSALDITAPEVPDYDFSTEFGDPEIDENEDDNTEIDDVSYDTLDNFFDQLNDEKENQDNEVNKLQDYAEVDRVIPDTKSDKDQVESAILVDDDEKSVWGSFD